MITLDNILALLLVIATTAVISFLVTPLVISLAPKIGAMDIPKDSRRVHDHPIPRLGGFAIFIAFLVGVLVFVDIDYKLQGILIGAVIIVIEGVIDDIVSLPALVKLAGQIAAAVVAVVYGLRIEIMSLFFGDAGFVFLGALSIPITIIWIVGVTNAVNLIDGLDGLACGVSTIASATMLVVAMNVVGEDFDIPLVLAALIGACLGFLPYNFNPAKIFMGDTGALLLGYVLSTVSILGFFKFYAVISFVVPFLALGLPIFDTTAAIIRRLIHGQSPFKPDKGHIHHKLINSGLSQKQAVAVLYTISALLGVVAVVITTSGKYRFVLLIVAAICAIVVDRRILKKCRGHKHGQCPEAKSGKNDEGFTGKSGTESASAAKDKNVGAISDIGKEETGDTAEAINDAGAEDEAKGNDCGAGDPSQKNGDGSDESMMP